MNTITAVFIFLIGISIVLGILIYAFRNHPPKENACDCHNPQWCNKWCCGKENFTKAQQFSITEECKHPNRLTRVLSSYGTCETTIEVCTDCFIELSQPKTDCR